MPLGFGEPPASLTMLDLSYNLFDGTLPTNWSQSGLSNLTHLYLNNCNFSGALPDAWGTQLAFQSLQFLDIHSNSIEDGLPASWASEVKQSGKMLHHCRTCAQQCMILTTLDLDSAAKIAISGLWLHPETQYTLCRLYNADSCLHAET